MMKMAKPTESDRKLLIGNVGVEKSCIAFVLHTGLYSKTAYELLNDLIITINKTVFDDDQYIDAYDFHYLDAGNTIGKCINGITMRKLPVIPQDVKLENTVNVKAISYVAYDAYGEVVIPLRKFDRDVEIKSHGYLNCLLDYFKYFFENNLASDVTMLTLKHLENALRCKNDDAGVFASLIGMPFNPILAAAYETAQIKRNEKLRLVFIIASTHGTFFFENDNSLEVSYFDFLDEKKEVENVLA